MAKWLLLVFVSLAVSAHAQSPAGHPIEKALHACLDKARGTADEVACADKAYALWDKELNRAYGVLNKALSPEGKQALKTTQQEWLKHRDAEFRLIDSVYSGLAGTMYQPARVHSRMRIVRERALLLEHYLELLEHP